MADVLDDRAYQLELARLSLERAKFRYEVVKWLIVAVGALGSFYLIDLARLHLEQFRATAENERALLTAYMEASNTQDPDLWVRKLVLIQTLSTNPSLQDWAKNEINYVNDCSAKVALYQETLHIASKLLDPNLDPAEYKLARKRFEELYSADLPYVNESPEVGRAMVIFRQALIKIESKVDTVDTSYTTFAMYGLGTALRGDDPKKDKDKCLRGVKKEAPRSVTTMN